MIKDDTSALTAGYCCLFYLIIEHRHAEGLTHGTGAAARLRSKDMLLWHTTTNSGEVFMENNIYRKKCIDRVSSPEQLNDYIHTSNPGVWMVLAAIIILLAGVCVWGVFGHLDSVLPAVGVCENGAVTCYVGEEGMDSVKEGMKVRISGEEFTVSAISAMPVMAKSELDEYALHQGGLQADEWVYKVTFVSSLPDGIYEAEIITESVAPISFVLN